MPRVPPLALLAGAALVHLRAHDRRLAPAGLTHVLSVLAVLLFVPAPEGNHDRRAGEAVVLAQLVRQVAAIALVEAVWIVDVKDEVRWRDRDLGDEVDLAALAGDV